MVSNKIALVSGGFDPVHGGHIDYLKEAATHGLLIVGLNSDEWLINKKGKAFMSFDERKQILESFKFVHRVIDFNDSDNSACDAIEKTLKLYGNDLVFCNGGDRTFDNQPEEQRFNNVDRVSFEYDVGGGKTNSSSILLGQWERNVTKRKWGYYEILYEVPKTKVKELVVKPGESLSLQQHKHRAEHWFVASGTATLRMEDGDFIFDGNLEEHEIITIPVNAWHQLSNNTDEDLNIVEIQYGDKCIESDIVRKDHK